MDDDLTVIKHIEAAIDQLESGPSGDNTDDALAHLRAALDYLRE